GKDKAALYCVGKRGRDYFARRGWNIVGQALDLRGHLDLVTARKIAAALQDYYATAATDAVYLCYNQLVSPVISRGRVEKFLPLDPQAMGLGEAVGVGRIGIEYIFEPSRDEVFAQLLPRYCEARILAVLAETMTAEHTARMIAMNNASNNCDELIDTVTLRINKARQAAITKEITEIMGGAEALRA
ncbi:F0F1 ATP synthase subunit gamma, partial [Candidatus Sumerlaeota bacterium]|nr:F0F1 ATP synthase subunit gamma [Candidatus Sumerlaeota bacterium]